MVSRATNTEQIIRLRRAIKHSWYPDKILKQKRLLTKLEMEELMEELINDISNINSNNHGSATQITAKEHEEKVSGIFQNKFKAKTIEKEKFRKFIKLNGNGRQWSHGEDSFNRICDESLEVNNNSLQLVSGENYIIDQPSGGQDFPDCVMVHLDERNNLQIAYIECKQMKPKFNNNPPKMNKNCLYVCGKKIYNGYLLTTPEWQEHNESYKKKYKELVDEFTNDEFKPVVYKVIELNWGRDGPKSFIERAEQNIPLITVCLSRYLNQ